MHKVIIMCSIRSVLLFVPVILCSVPSAIPSIAESDTHEKPIWAKYASALDLSCTQHPASIYSPDHRSSVEVICKGKPNEDPVYALRLSTPDGHLHELKLEEGAHELLWAPDSTSFFVNGGFNAYAGFFVSVYKMDPSVGATKLTVLGAAQADMVKTFPPCKAWNREDEDCARISRNPQFNMSGLTWAKSSAAIYVFAEVPCSSSYGGIMCQVQGYELSVRDGRILNRLSAAQIKRQWSQYADWNIRVPDPPQYGPAHVTW